MRKRRAGHIAFKMNNKLYVAGGKNTTDKFLSCCKRYVIKEGNRENRLHVLPCTFPYVMDSVSPDESFAIIVGRKKDYKKIYKFSFS